MARVRFIVYEPLAVAQVQVGLSPIVSHEDLSMLVGGHGSRIHVDIRIQLQHRDSLQPLLLKKSIL